MGKTRTVSKETHKGLSRYALKQLTKQKTYTEPATPAPAPKTAPAPAPQPNQPVMSVTATMTGADFTRGRIFLETSDGTKVLLRLRELRAFQGLAPIWKGYTVECEVEDIPDGQGLRVKRLFSVRDPA